MSSGGTPKFAANGDSLAFGRKINALSASHSRAADCDQRSSTVCRSNVERLMTLSTSAVAVCCSSDFAQLVEQTRVLDGDDGLVGEGLEKIEFAHR